MTTAERGAERSSGPRSATRQFAATILSLEAFVVFFATLVAHGLRSASSSTVWVVGGALALGCLLLAGLLHRPGAYSAGTALQVLVLVGAVAAATRDVTGVMFLLIWAVFVALWVASLRLGARIDRERVERFEVERAEGERFEAERAEGGSGAADAG